MTKSEEKLIMAASKPDIIKRQRKMGKWVIICLPFTILFGLGAIPLFIIAAKSNRLAVLIRHMELLEKYGKLSFDAFTLGRYGSKDICVKVAAKLIESKNLDGYEIIGDIGVAKIEMHATVKDFEPVPLEVIYKEVKQIYNCPNCGSAITANSKSCPYCGTKLN
ncbi:MAG: zinc ribbon domain-containing protein [Firmicutes bacterium]|nr:zinc ribbon domain-containing protein [Bacillota bacterium]